MQKENRKIIKLGLFIWLLAASFYLYEFFLRTFIGTIVPELTQSLHLNAEQLSIIGSAYYLTYGLMQIPVGMLIDRYGTRLLLNEKVEQLFKIYKNKKMKQLLEEIKK